jgi:serine/threonine protein phosphatase PrpC
MTAWLEPRAAAAACPSCGRLPGPEDNFCEACGTKLSRASANGSARGIAAACPFCASTRVGADGYCESCGRIQPSHRDRAEFHLGLLAGVTDRGLRHHRNEDAMALAITELASGPAAAAVVCDGVSGSPHPDEAARAAARALVQALMEGVCRGGDPPKTCAAAFELARDALAELAGRPDAPADDAPATTFVAAMLTSQAITVCWLGDSRAYWLGAGPRSFACQLTSDDSVAAEMAGNGHAAQATALTVSEAHALTRWIGADIRDAPHVTAFEPPGPGALLLCSDGLWNYQPDPAELARLALPALADPLFAATTLVSFALSAGGADNVTAVLAPLPLGRPAVAAPGEVLWRLPAEPVLRRDRP